ncbi:MAG: tRNA 2-thiouridine(34) synthase MnmA [Candidatus Muiribacteriota bacterium]
MNILVGMSGGVDSSVTTLLLSEQGNNVTGMTLKLYNEFQNTCCSDSAIMDAKAICEKLGISHIKADYEKEFYSEVVKPFIDEYLRGNTPNPCIECNRQIKFKLLLDEKEKHGADYIATGHYCNIENISGNWSIVQGEDETKDQSYFLYPLREEWLPYILFPLGKLHKKNVKEKAALYGFEKIKNKKESFEICFIPDSYKKFILQKVGTIHGKIILYPEMKEIGTHNGIYNFTKGQSRGLKVSIGKKLYVKEIDSQTNVVYVSDEKHLYSTKAVLKNVNFFTIFKNRIQDKNYFKAKIRHYAPKVDIKILQYDINSKEAVIEFLKPAKSVTCGQSAVIYDEKTLMFGGIISRAL